MYGRRMAVEHLIALASVSMFLNEGVDRQDITHV
jgi:hypothetical protein